MSACISTHGEYSSHEYKAGECQLCGHVNLNIVRAEALRELADEVERIDPAWDSALFVDGSYHPLPDWIRNLADKMASA